MAAAERTAQLHSHAVTSYLDSTVLLNVYLLNIGTEEWQQKRKQFLNNVVFDPF